MNVHVKIAVRYIQYEFHSNAENKVKLVGCDNSDRLPAGGLDNRTPDRLPRNAPPNKTSVRFGRQIKPSGMHDDFIPFVSRRLDSNLGSLALDAGHRKGKKNGENEACVGNGMIILVAHWLSVFNWCEWIVYYDGWFFLGKWHFVNSQRHKCFMSTITNVIANCDSVIRAINIFAWHLCQKLFYSQCL